MSKTFIWNCNFTFDFIYFIYICNFSLYLRKKCRLKIVKGAVFKGYLWNNPKFILNQFSHMQGRSMHLICFCLLIFVCIFFFVNLMLLWLLTSLVRPFNNAHIVTYTMRLVLWATNKLKHSTCWWKVIFAGDGFEAYPQELFARVTANLSSEHKIVSAEDCYNNEWMAGFLFCCGLNVVLTANMTQLLMVCTVNCFILFIYLFIMFVVMFFQMWMFI